MRCHEPLQAQVFQARQRCEFLPRGQVLRSKRQASIRALRRNLEQAASQQHLQEEARQVAVSRRRVAPAGQHLRRDQPPASHDGFSRAGCGRIIRGGGWRRRHDHGPIGLDGRQQVIDMLVQLGQRQGRQRPGLTAVLQPGALHVRQPFQIERRHVDGVIFIGEDQTPLAEPLEQREGGFWGKLPAAAVGHDQRKLLGRLPAVPHADQPAQRLALIGALGLERRAHATGVPQVPDKLLDQVRLGGAAQGPAPVLGRGAQRLDGDAGQGVGELLHQVLPFCGREGYPHVGLTIPHDPARGCSPPGRCGRGFRTCTPARSRTSAGGRRRSDPWYRA